MCDRLHIDVRKTRTERTNSSTLQRRRETPSLFEKQPFRTKYQEAAHNTNIVMVDSGNQKVNHVTHQPQTLSNTMRMVWRLLRPTATRPWNYCANCYSETTLLKYTDSQILIKKQTNKQQAPPPPQSSTNCQLHRGKRLIFILPIPCFPFVFSIRCSF